MLGGILRMTISLTMIVLETTSDIQFLLPIMTTLMISKVCGLHCSLACRSLVHAVVFSRVQWVGDLFNISLYDLHIELKSIPFVEAVPPDAMVHLQAKDIMSKSVFGSVLRCCVA